MGQRCEFKDLEGSYLRKYLCKYIENCLIEVKITEFNEWSYKLD